MKIKRKIALSVLILVLTGGIAVAACARHERETAAVAPQVLRGHMVARAQVVAREGTAELGARIAGKALRVLVREGELVEPGQLLAELEADDLSFELARARADVKSLEAQLAATIEGARAEEREAATAEASAARAEVALAEDRKLRQERLISAAVSTDERRTEADHGLDAARARLAAAEARERLSKSGGRSADIDAARARVAAAQARVQQLEAQLSWTKITAPRKGIVLSRRVSPGDTVAPGGLLFEVVDACTELKVEVEQREALGLVAGSGVRVTLPGGGAVLAKGRVVRVGGRLERRTIGAEEARVRADALVLPAWVELEGCPPLPLGARLEALVDRPPVRVEASVPREAVLVRDGRALVRTPRGLLTTDLAVELGSCDDENIEVRGIPVGVRVLLSH